MAEWSIASDLKSDELNRFREFESHFLLYCKDMLLIISVTSITTPFPSLDFLLLESSEILFFKNSKTKILYAYFNSSNNCVRNRTFNLLFK